MASRGVPLARIFFYPLPILAQLRKCQVVGRLAACGYRFSWCVSCVSSAGALVTGSHLIGRAQCIAPLRAMNVNINVNINVNDYNRGGDFEGLKLKM